MVDASVAAIQHCGLAIRGSVPEVSRRRDAWCPNQMRRSGASRRRRLQLDERVHQAWPLRRPGAAQGLPFERAVEGLLVLEHEVDDPRELLRDERARERRRLPARRGAVEGADLGEVLDRPHGRVAEGELQMAVAVLRALVARPPAGVAGAGDAFSAGLIVSRLENRGWDDAVRFATAARALKHSIPGDFCLVTRGEVDQLLRGKRSFGDEIFVVRGQ